jgi:SAM-dependent methyltransferase
VTVSDLDPTSVANIANGELGAHPRVRTQVVDATATAADDHTYDLVVSAQAFHHLPPATAVRVIAEATRVGKRFLVIDLKRPSPLGLIFTQLTLAPLAAVAVLVRPSFRRIMHDGFISALRAYSQPAFIALGKAANPQMHIEFLPTATRFGLKPTSFVFSRPNATPISGNELEPKASQQS